MAWAAWSKCLRSAVKIIVIALSIVAALFLTHQFILPIVAFVFPSLDSFVFDIGAFGAYPAETYASFHLGGPKARHPVWDPVCDQGLVLMTPNGPSVARPGPVILDSRGELVWMSDGFGTTANLKVQHYKGEDYLTLWSGEKAATSGKGVYFMLDSTYQVTRMISAAGHGLFGDLHEFKITKQGTALLTVYNTTNADLTRMGMGRGTNGWIVDNLFQEIDIETGELLFQWSAVQHFDPADTFMTNPFGGYWESIPFDFYHLNSVDKDSKGNYIISSRHFHHVMCISPEGETLWILGGAENEFKDLSDGQATNFKWQHDARWISEEDGILTLFDNSKAGPFHSDAPESRALVIQLDLENMTAKLVQSMTSLQGILASSQGSVQVLPESNNFFVGWGSAAAYSEYSPKGELLCETHLGASWFYSFERMKSYRTTKTSVWRGMPMEPPQVKIQDDVLAVSWNGATEVTYWALEATDARSSSNRKAEHVDAIPLALSEGGSPDGEFDVVDIIPRAGFESSFDLSQLPADKTYVKFRAVALDAEHHVLRYSEPYEPEPGTSEVSYLMTIFKLCLVAGFLVGLRFAFKHFRANGHLRNWGTGQSQGLLSPVASPAWMAWRAPAEARHSNRQGVAEWIQMKWSGARHRPR